MKNKRLKAFVFSVIAIVGVFVVGIFFDSQNVPVVVSTIGLLAGGYVGGQSFTDGRKLKQ